MKSKFVPTCIFVVEDDPMYQRLVKYVMELNPDHQVHIFSTGQECLQHLHLNPTIVSLDYSLPDMTGEEVLKKIKDYNKDISVLILSSQQDVSTAVKLLREGEPFVAVNMSAIPKDLLESELFGHEKGAFTGANTRKRGLFEMANKGTLFLDEIGEMDINLQAKVLRALQEREIHRVGAEKSIAFDARVIVATHRNLQDEVSEGNFREDLFYRLLGLPIALPPLRDRGNDIILLANFFLKNFIKNNGLSNLKISKEAKNKLLNYSFPGNVRELKAIIDLAAVLTNEAEIGEADIRFNSPKKGAHFLSDEMTMESYKKMIVTHFLEKYDNDIDKVAKKLDIGKSTIYRMLKEEKEMSMT